MLARVFVMCGQTMFSLWGEMRSCVTCYTAGHGTVWGSWLDQVIHWRCYTRHYKQYTSTPCEDCQFSRYRFFYIFKLSQVNCTNLKAEKNKLCQENRKQKFFLKCALMVYKAIVHVKNLKIYRGSNFMPEFCVIENVWKWVLRRLGDVYQYLCKHVNNSPFSLAPPRLPYVVRSLVLFSLVE